MLTPFSNAVTYFQTVAKQCTVGDFTKWVLIPQSTLASGTYRLGTSSSAAYYGSFSMKASGSYTAPWEVWLPTSLTAGSVVISKRAI